MASAGGIETRGMTLIVSIIPGSTKAIQSGTFLESVYQCYKAPKGPKGPYIRPLKAQGPKGLYKALKALKGHCNCTDGTDD